MTLDWLFGPSNQEAAMRSHWLKVERASLECHAANLEALKAWRSGNRELQSKWTDEMNRRLNQHATLLDQWAELYQPWQA